MAARSNLQRSAEYYASKMKLRVFPCWPRAKNPVTERGCLDATTDPEQIARWWMYSSGNNVAIATGGGLVVLDVDINHEAGKYGDETLAELEQQYGPLPDTWMCLTGGGGIHYYFACDDPDLTVGASFAPGLDYRGAGGYVIAPPSVHESGRTYEWEASHRPEDTPIAILPDWLHRLMKQARSKPRAESGKDTPERITEGKRNDELFRLASSLRSKGLTVEEITAAVLEANKNRCAPPLPTAEVETICKSAGRYEMGQSSPTGEWEPPIPFDTIETPPFPLESLPGPLCAFVEALAESTQTPEEMAGILSLGVLSTAFQSRYTVSVTPDWWEPLCLYTVAVAAPGERKSAVISALTRPIYDYEAERRDTEAEDVAQNRTERALLEKDLQEAQKKAVSKKGRYEDGRIEALSISSQLARFVDKHEYQLLADDTTQEKLVEIMSRQGGCITVTSAEGGVFDIMTGRYDSGANLDVYLKAHAGDPITVQRIGRKRNAVPDPRLTMMLTIQPEVLGGLMDNATLRGRGMCGRFLYALCRSKVGRREISPPCVPEAVNDGYRQFVRRILAGEGRGVIHLSREADRVREDYQRHIERKLGDEWEFMRDWGGKAVGAAVRIAALIHAAETTGDPTETTISPETMTAAVKIAEFLGSHAEAAYKIMGADQGMEDAKYLWRRIQAADCAEISKRDLFQMCQGKFKTVENMEPALSLLADMGYIREEEKSTGGRGRPSKKIIVNPHAKYTKNTKIYRAG